MWKDIAAKVLYYPIKWYNLINIRKIYSEKKLKVTSKVELPLGKTLVISPHVDDETIGLGGLLDSNRANNRQVDLIYLTDSSGSKSNSFEDTKTLREKEARQLVTELNMGDLKILKAKNNDVNPYTDEVVRELHEFLSRKNYEKVFVVSPFDAHYEHRWTNNVFFKALNGGDFDFDIYLYEVSNLLPDEWINTFHTFNGEKKKKIFDLFISQKVAMDFDIFLQLNRFKGLPLGEKSFVELFSKLSVKEYKKLMESFSEEEIKEKLPRRIANHRTFYKVLRDNK